jgi:hypothetical protein
MTDKLLEVALCSYLLHDVTFISSMDKPFDEFGTQPIQKARGVDLMFGGKVIITHSNDAYAIETCKLRLRDISCLTKPITVANYNQGEEFVPIVELAKRFHVNHKYEVTHYDQVKHHEEAKAFVVNCCVENDSNRYNYYVVSYKNIDDIPVGVIEFLNMCLIDWRDLIGKGLAVEITEL